MIKIEHISVFNFEGALRGLRNPLESWDKSDSGLCCKFADEECERSQCKFYEKIEGERNIGHLCNYDTKATGHKFLIGKNDLILAQKMLKGGPDEAKFMRQIFVSMDITAPLYWWKELDTYKVATVANSTSTMHKLATTPITRDLFSFDCDEPFNDETQIEDYARCRNAEDFIITHCEWLRNKYNETKDKRYWRKLIQILSEGWNQTRTWTGNYANLRNIYFARRHHKLSEWHDFCKIIEELPYGKELICYE